MNISPEDYKTLKELEESMWIRKTRFDYAYMDRLLSPNFVEFGRSGRIYRREDTLSAPDQEIKATLPLKNLNIRLIDTHVAQVTYISEVMYEELEVGNRSSIWIKNISSWQLVFHQGTPS